MSFSKAAVFLLTAFFSHVLLSPYAFAQPVPLSSLALTDSAPIIAPILNNAGTVAFAVGGKSLSTDGLVLARSNQLIKFGAVGDAAPGFPGKVFVGFLANFAQPYLLALNDRDEVAFQAIVMDCPDVANVSGCLQTGSADSYGLPYSYGLFVYSEGEISKLLATGDEAPETAGLIYRSFDHLWLNNKGDILFTSTLQSADRTYSSGLFLFSSGVVQKIALQGETTPIGSSFVFFFGSVNVLFNDDGVITFIERTGVFHYSGGTFTKDLAVGDPAPDGRTFLGIGAAANGEGDVAFNASFGPALSDQGLFLRRKDGSIVQILMYGDPTPLGGTFGDSWVSHGSHGAGPAVTFFLLAEPKLNKSGDVLFAVNIKDGPVPGALFLYTSEGINTLIASGDSGLVLFKPLPGTLATPISSTMGYKISDSGSIAFTSEVSDGRHGWFRMDNGSVRKIAVQGDAAPAPGQFFSINSWASAFAMNDHGDISFAASLCCGQYWEGLFFSASDKVPVINGDFELPGDNGLPASWQIVWHNSGSGDAFQYQGGADVAKGTSALRLHVNPGGGSTFVLSDEIPVLPDRSYLISASMRYNLSSNDDAVLFSVLQFDLAGNLVGFDEIRGLKDENYWQWQPKSLGFQTNPLTNSIRIRFGLVSATEAYLDVDDVR